MANAYGVGTRIEHPKYGEGIVTGGDLGTLNVFFKDHGDKDISRDFEGITVVAQPDKFKEALSMDEVQEALMGVLSKFADFTMLIPLGDKWKGGTMSLLPSDTSLKGKDIPIETFFHKIVMVRDRLRVMEQAINSNSKLSDEDKVNLQQYITRVYGSLTTFNVLFQRKDDYFVGESSKD